MKTDLQRFICIIYLVCVLSIFFPASTSQGAEEASGEQASREEVGTPQLVPVETVPVAVYCGLSRVTQEQAVLQGVDYLVPTETWYAPHPALAHIVPQLHSQGIKVYPSLAVGIDSVEGESHSFAAAHPEYFEKLRNGQRLQGGEAGSLSWGFPEVRRYKVEKIRELVEMAGCDGVALDYTRYLDPEAGYSKAIVDAFIAETGRNPFRIPNDDPEWVRFRASQVTLFLIELRAALDQLRPDIEIFAIVGPDPDEALKQSMQDWAGWIEEGLIDGLITMNYDRDTNRILSMVQSVSALVAGRLPYFPMIAAWGENLDTPELLMEGAKKCLAAGGTGVAIYRDDAITQANLWSTVGQIAAWPTRISAATVNLLRNASFEQGLSFWAVGEGAGVSVSTDQALEGKQALRIQPSGAASVRQLVSEGVPHHQRGATLTFSLDDSKLSLDRQLHVEITVNFGNGVENFYRVPVDADDASDESGWRKARINFPVESENGIEFLVIALTVESDGGVLYADDFHLAFHNRRSRLQPTTPPAVWEGDSRGNRLRGQIVTGSSQFGNGYEPDRAVDGRTSAELGDREAAWFSQRPNENQWIMVHLPAPAKIRRFRLLNPAVQAAYRTRDFVIETSLDGAAFREVARGTMPNNGTTWLELKVRPVRAKYVRFRALNGYYPGYFLGLKEIEAY